MSNHEYYYEVKSKSTIKNVALDFIEKNNNWVDFEEFTVLPIENIYDSLVKHDQFLSKLYEQLPFIGAFLKFEKNSVYDWHTDVRVRKTSLNLLITENCHSHTIFSKDRGRHHDKACTFVELKYKPQTYYVLNTQIEHMVLNFKPNRILLSITFDKDISYLDVLSNIMTLEV